METEMGIRLTWYCVGLFFGWYTCRRWDEFKEWRKQRKIDRAAFDQLSLEDWLHREDLVIHPRVHPDVAASDPPTSAPGRPKKYKPIDTRADDEYADCTCERVANCVECFNRLQSKSPYPYYAKARKK